MRAQSQMLPRTAHELEVAVDSCVSRAREVSGILLLAVGLFVGLSLASLWVGAGMLMGPFGQAAARALYSIFGVASYLIAAAILGFAFRLLGSRPLGVPFAEAAGGLGLTLSGSVLLHVLWPGQRFLGSSPGGMVGEYGGEILRAFVSSAGATLVGGAVAGISLVLVTHCTVRGLLCSLAGRLLWVGRKLARVAAAFVWLALAGGRLLLRIFPQRSGAPDAADAEEATDLADVADAAVGGAAAENATAEGTAMLDARRELGEGDQTGSAGEACASRRRRRTRTVQACAGIAADGDTERVEVISLEEARAEKAARAMSEAAVAAEVAVMSEPVSGPAEADHAQAAGFAASGAAMVIAAQDRRAATEAVAGTAPVAQEPTIVETTFRSHRRQDVEAGRDGKAAAREREGGRPAEKAALERGTAERGTAERGTAERGTAERGTAERSAVERGAAPQDFIPLGNGYTLPPLEILDYAEPENAQLDRAAMRELAARLEKTLVDYSVLGRVTHIHPGPVVTMYEFVPTPGTKLSRITALSSDLAMALEAVRVRIVAPIPGKAAVGIEVPNRQRETVYLKEILGDEVLTKAKSKLSVALGKDISGQPVAVDLARMPHLLIAGTTGAGKSVAVNAMICSLLYNATPEEVRFLMVDPKMLELNTYDGIPHLLLPVVTDPKKANLALRWAVDEMERRYELLAAAGVRDIVSYNRKLQKVLDEAAQPPARAEGQARGNVRHIRVLVESDEGTRELDLERLSGSNRRSAGSGAVPLVAASPEEAQALAEVMGAPAQTSLGGGGGLAPLLVAAAEAQAAASAAASGATAATGAPNARTVEKPRKLPYIVIVIDEFADLMMAGAKDAEWAVTRIAQKARAAGIHLLLATQRPSVNVITGIIKANLPSRIAFQVASKQDSRVILDAHGAEDLLGAGDMLFTDRGLPLRRVHGCLVTGDEVKRVTDLLRAQGRPVYDLDILRPRSDESEGAEEDDLSDEMYDQAVALVADTRQASISMIQRKLRIGYNRAARMVERMEREGIVGPADGAKPRDVLVGAMAL